MREILEICVELDETARDTYLRLADACTDDPALAERLREMASDETEHVAWWRELLIAWDNGLLPDIVNEPETLAIKLGEVLAEMRDALPEECTGYTPEQALAVAAKLEFFMIDPAFGELLDLTEPAIAEQRHAEYAAHLERLISMITDYYSPDSLSAFLAKTLRRSWQDNRELAAYAIRDPLTGLYNRRAFTAHMRQWTSWAARYGRPVSVLLIDVDNLKEVNDRLGHGVGDRILRRIATALCDSVRSSDIVARYGGDEFAILAPETDEELLRQLADRVLTAVRRAHELGDGIRVTVSIGTVVASDRQGSAPRTLEELLAAADQGLYSAKANGRDRAAEPAVLSTIG